MTLCGKVKIRAVNTGKKITGNYSDVFAFTTAPAAVKIKNVELTDESYVKLSWYEAAGADAYTIYFSKVDANGNAVKFQEIKSLLQHVSRPDSPTRTREQ